MPGSAWAVKFSGRAAMPKETFAATIELTEDEAALVRETAAFYKMGLSDFLAGALRSGIAHAEDRMDMYDETKTATPFDADDLPF
jgi:hypothetical protein